MTADPRPARAHERRLARRLEARGQPGLAEVLVRLRGTTFGGRWRLDALYAVGAEGAVYLATDVADAKAPVHVAKVALLPYHRPAEIASGVVRLRRRHLREEAENLARSGSPYMPACLGLCEFENPLLDPNRGGAFTEPEPVLVMERLPGIDVDLWLARVHRTRLSQPILRQNLDRVAVVLLQALRDLQDRGFLYADLRPGNLRMIGRPIRRVRLLDAGSLVEVGDASGKFPHVPHYLPPALFEQRYAREQPIVPTEAVQAVMAGRTLYEVATGSVPVPGQAIDSAALAAGGVSAPVADVVDGLAAGGFPSVLHALRYLARRAAKRLPPPPPPGSAPPAPPPPRRLWGRRLAAMWRY